MDEERGVSFPSCNQQHKEEAPPMTNYARLSEKPQPFLSLTAYTVAEFQDLLPTFRAAFLRHMQINTLDATAAGTASWLKKY
jgi:hypothetical protein